MSEKLCQNAFYEAMELRGKRQVLKRSMYSRKVCNTLWFFHWLPEECYKKMWAQAERALPRPLCIIYVYAVRSLAPMQMEALGLLIYAAALALILWASSQAKYN